MENKEMQQQNDIMPQLDTVRKPGGLYRHIKMSVRSANILVIVTSAILIFTMLFLVNHNGFTIKFDTNGGSYIENSKVMHSEAVPEPKQPVKEGWVFTGWYLDRDCTVKWDIKNDKVTESMTLYAGWETK